MTKKQLELLKVTRSAVIALKIAQSVSINVMLILFWFKRLVQPFIHQHAYPLLSRLQSSCTRFVAVSTLGVEVNPALVP